MSSDVAVTVVSPIAGGCWLGNYLFAAVAAALLPLLLLLLLMPKIRRQPV